MKIDAAPVIVHLCRKKTVESVTPLWIWYIFTIQVKGLHRLERYQNILKMLKYIICFKFTKIWLP